MTTIYYNFPAISLPLQGLKDQSKKEIQLSHIGQPLTNIQVNNINYSAYSVFIGSSSSSQIKTPGHLIIKCYSDINDPTSNSIYFAIPLKPTKSDASNTKSDVDNIIDADGGVVELTVNNYIKNGADCFISAMSNSCQTITLGANSAIPIQEYVDKDFYNISSIPNASVEQNVGNNKNAILQQQDLDWIMSCELLTEDGPTEKQQMDPGTTATTVSLLLMSIMIAFTVYIGGPILYKETGTYKFIKMGLNNNHYTVNVFWGITLILLGILCIVQGISSNTETYYFIAIGVFLSYFSGTSGILKMDGVANSQGDGFITTENPFQIYSEIFSSRCYSTTGRIIKIIIFFVLASSFVSMISSMALKSREAFTTSLFIFLFIAFLQVSSVSYFNKISAAPAE